MNTKYSYLPLDWVNNGYESVADTPYGRATITEVHDPISKKLGFGTHKYSLRVEYISGEVENVHHAFASLSEAEGWAFMCLQTYAEKSRNQRELTDLLSTLDICRQSIPAELKKGSLEKLQRIEFILREHFE